jgi:hypothetical protein
MVIFNSYVKLPEGSLRMLLENHQLIFAQKSSHRKGKLWKTGKQVLQEPLNQFGFVQGVYQYAPMWPL